MTNARNLAKKWITLYKLENPDWAKIAGIMQNLLYKHKADDIEKAILTYYFHYPKSTIVGFSAYCKRIILWEKRKQKKKKRKY